MRILWGKNYKFVAAQTLAGRGCSSVCDVTLLEPTRFDGLGGAGGQKAGF